MESGTSTDNFLTGNGILIILFFLFLIGGGNMFGNNNALTQADLQTSLYNQTTNENLSDIRTAQCATENLINANAMTTNNAIAESKYENLLQFKDMANQMCQCCNDMKTTVITENQATRDMIQQNYISGLLTTISDLKSDISDRNTADRILDTTGGWVANSSCGCGCNCNRSLS